MRRYLSSFYATLLALLLLLPSTMAKSAWAAVQTFSYNQAQAAGLAQTGWVVSNSNSHAHLETTNATNEIALAFTGTRLVLGGLYYQPAGAVVQVNIDNAGYVTVPNPVTSFSNGAFVVADGLSDTPHTVRFKQSTLGQFAFVYTGETAGDVFATVTGANPALGQLDTTTPLVSPSLTAGTITKTTVTLWWGIASGGVAPYTYQLFRGAASAGNEVGGATTSPGTDSGRTVQTAYIYRLKTTDAANNTIVSAPLTVQTHGPFTVKIGFIGDSITRGAGSSTSPPAQFVLKMQELYPQLDVPLFNYGLDGRRARQLSRLSGGSAGITALVTQMQADGIQYVGLMLGTNDWYSYSQNDAAYSRAAWLADIQDICAAITAAGIKVYVNQLIFRADVTGADDASVGIPNWNAGLAGLPFAGLLRQGDTANYAAIKAAYNANPTGGGILPNDFLHPNEVGGAIIAQDWASAMGPNIVAEVAPTIASITVSPAAITITAGQSMQAFSAVANDGSGVALATQPVFTWTVAPPTISGGGSLSVPTSIIVTASASGISGTATATLPVSSGGTGNGATLSQIQAELDARGLTSAKVASLPTATQAASAVLAAVVDGSITIKQALGIQASVNGNRYSVGTLNVTNHTQVTTYYRVDATTPVATMTVTYGPDNRTPVSRTVVFTPLP